MDILSSVRGRLFDVLDGTLDDATDPPLIPEPRHKFLFQLDAGHIPSVNWDPFAKTELRTRKFVQSEYHKMAQ